jgi:hypothetical protein
LASRTVRCAALAGSSLRGLLHRLALCSSPPTLGRLCRGEWHAHMHALMPAASDETYGMRWCMQDHLGSTGLRACMRHPLRHTGMR